MREAASAGGSGGTVAAGGQGVGGCAVSLL